MRFGQAPFKSNYDISIDADYVAVHKHIFLNKYDITKALRKGGILCINSPYKTVEDWNKNVSAKLRKEIA